MELTTEVVIAAMSLVGVLLEVARSGYGAYSKLVIQRAELIQQLEMCEREIETLTAELENCKVRYALDVATSAPSQRPVTQVWQILANMIERVRYGKAEAV